MKLNKKKKMNPLIPVASMGDIAFLLIIFFMVTTNFVKESGIEYEEAQAPELAEVDKYPVSVVMDKEGQLWLQGEEVDIRELEMEVRNSVGKLPSNRRVVLVKIDKNLTHDKFAGVLLTLSKAEVEIALVGKEEPGRK